MRLEEMFVSKLFELGTIVPGVNTTPDVKPGETPRQAIKFGNKVDDGGIPPIMQTNGKVERSLKKS
jgi:hypothetical protein